MEAIQTDRLTLRNFCPEDWRDLHEVIVGYQASEYAQYDHAWPTSEEEIQGVARWLSEGEDYLAVCLRSTGKLVGLIALNQEEREDGPARNLGYIVHSGFHRQGYATEACRAAIEHVFGRLGATRFVTGTHAANLPSRRLLARLGFRELGDGMYGLERDEWLARGGLNSARPACAG